MGVGKFCRVSLLLLLIGCQSSVPTVQRFDDPFPVLNSVTQSPFFLVGHKDQEKNWEQSETHTPSGDVLLSDEGPTSPLSSEENVYEFVYETEDTPTLSEAEQAELLSQNLWIKNVNYIAMLDSGKKSNNARIASEERKRRDELNLLNMSPQERAKRQNQRFDYIDGTASDWRWLHRGVDKLIALPPSQRVNFGLFFREKYKNQKILRANAAILMGREGDFAIGKFLLQVVQSESTDVKIRCAAAEILGRMPTITADELIPMLESAKTTEVWEEILVAIAEKIDPWEHTCFLEPFYSPISEMRLVTAKIWRRKSLENKGKVSASWDSQQFFEIARRETNSAVRVEIIKTLSALQVPDLFSLLEGDLHNRTAEIRNAAMLALADARCEKAIPIIKDQLRDSIGTNRAAVVSALRKLGALDEVFKKVDDTDWRVQVEVAKAFSERCSTQTATFAKSYISSTQQEVQLETIEAINGWSVEESGPLLLEAVKSPFSNVRSRAAELLAQRGVLYSGFDPEARPENQRAQYQELVEVFRETTGVDPQFTLNNKERNSSPIQQVSAIIPTKFPENAMLTEVRQCLDDWSDRDQRSLIQHRLTSHGAKLMPLIDHLMVIEKRNIPESLDNVFAEVDPMFREIEKLKSDDPLIVRRAAMELSQLGAVSSPPKLAAQRIVDLAEKQDDPLTLTHLLTALENADSDLVCQLARPLLLSESARVRRMACEMLQQHGSSEDVPLMHEVLRDPSPTVARGALLAVGTLLEEEVAVAPSILGTLRAMLVQGDMRMQTDVAATLHRLGHSEGTEALRRLAANNDHQIRTYVVKTISGLNDSAFEPMLIRFSDDKSQTVKNEALRGLRMLRGEDIEGGRSTQQQINRRKAWAN